VKLSLNKAAQTSGRAKATLLDAIRDGRLSAPKDAKGHYEIDPSELHRVFPFLSPDQAPTPSPEPLPTPLGNHPDTKGLEREVELLREMLNTAEKMPTIGVIWQKDSKLFWRTNGLADYSKGSLEASFHSS